MVTLFEETRINGMILQNRIVRSATWEGMADPDGRPTEKMIPFYKALAQGGSGLIISGFTFVHPDGKQLIGKMGIHTDTFSENFKKLTQAVHEANSKIAIQLVHAGGQTNAENAGKQPVAPSAVKVDQFPEVPAELTKEEINDIVTAFGDAAKRAKAWGFDAIQLHGAHGYLINQFLSPLTNHRDDKYGGSIENRSRFLFEVYGKVREKVGADFPVFIKLNATDNLEGGLTLEDAIFTARKLSDEGIDAIEVSSGTPASGAKGPARRRINKPEKEAYHLKLAKKIKKVVSCPVMVVGGIRSMEIAEKAVMNAGIDYVAMSRPLIREPNLPDLWQKGKQPTASCISCSGCFIPGMEEGGIYCVIKRKQAEKGKKA